MTAMLRADLAVIAAMVKPGARVLDVGCGDGDLLAWLAENRGVEARGIELSQAGVNACVARGLSVVQGDADSDLDAYPDGAFDHVILSQTIQATRTPRRVLEEIMRIGRSGLVSMPNFGHWRMRMQLLLRGRMPVTGTLPYAWYETPNLHMCTAADFSALVSALGLRIEQAVAISGGKTWGFSPMGNRANLFAETAVFEIVRG
jgi:methionine biosynthesis protein MetW